MARFSTLLGIPFPALVAGIDHAYPVRDVAAFRQVIRVLKVGDVWCANQRHPALIATSLRRAVVVAGVHCASLTSLRDRRVRVGEPLGAYLGMSLQLKRVISLLATLVREDEDRLW